MKVSHATGVIAGLMRPGCSLAGVERDEHGQPVRIMHIELTVADLPHLLACCEDLWKQQRWQAVLDRNAAEAEDARQRAAT